MTAFLDIVFSLFVGGMIVLMILNANFVMRDIWAYYSSDTIVQNMLISNAQILESELRNMGCGIPAGQQSIMIATDTCVKFIMRQRPENSQIDTVQFYCGSISELAATDNPHDRFLYRQFNSLPPQRIGLVANFRLKYYDTAGDLMSTPIPAGILVNIRLIEIDMSVQNPYSLMTYEETMEEWQKKSRWALGVWRQTRVASPNLIR